LFPIVIIKSFITSGPNLNSTNIVWILAELS
jgi:hypothetical protein